MTERRLRPEYHPLTDLFEALGLDEAEAETAAVGRDAPSAAYVDPFDQMVATFRNAGLSEAEARDAAVGREHQSEREAREAYRLANRAPRARGILIRSEEERRLVERSVTRLAASLIAREGCSIQEGHRRAARMAEMYREDHPGESSPYSFAAVMNAAAKEINVRPIREANP